MPRQDGTGPMGQGSMTGRGMGPCRGGIRGRGMRRGMGWFGGRLSKDEEKEILEEEKKYLEEELEEVKKELSSVKS